MGFPNKQGIKEINFSVQQILYCPMGADYYKATFDIKIEEPNEIPDYMDIQDWFKRLDGQRYILEDAAALARDKMLAFTSGCKRLEVACTSDCANHFPITVKC